MALEIREIHSRKEIKRFIEFANDLYKDCPYYCPPLFFDEMNCFNPEKNPALEVSEYQLWMAYRDGEPVGRIAGIINHRANEKWGFKHVRFGWFDFIDDMEVSKALLDTVAAWGKARGMKELNGPVGFTDFDHEGLLPKETLFIDDSKKNIEAAQALGIRTYHISREELVRNLFVNGVLKKGVV